MEFTIEQIAGMLKGSIEGNGSLLVNKLAKIEEATAGCLAFLSNQKYEPYLYTTEATAVIVGKDFEPKKEYTATLIRVDNPYLAFTVLLEQYQQYLMAAKVGIEQPSFIGDNSTTGNNIFRGAFSYIGSNCKIGNNVKIYPQAYIGDNVTIGDNTVIYAGAKIYSDIVIGNRCVVHAGAVIGSDGFGFAPQPDGSYRPIPQVGNVVLEDDVCIGANTVVDCATMGSTIIRQGAKLDNLIQIAHNVEIGKHTVIAAQSGISGSTKIGNYCVIAGQVGIVGHLQIADKTSFGAQSGVSKSIQKEGLKLQGSPAFDYKDNLRSLAVFRNLPQLQKRLEELEEKILTLSINEK
ncbi:UDP-3-O-(3-hydroxymyristoyl)glucosamine N-acyltransferase [Cytophagaceae bacterium YF14B1]|uniref:UDP-3-O-acylglucosamine N-acyltransferase n=1 Tax=Xanthocytophaga flava TaxID=3048013 RepID=A0AAE3QQ70_9BACT|nr:UDP-3-O-(3-hydroxymyristoyl)glucosamine N-acyltransferase [Xanthocytophaga flavus]MDJ1483457.1 UDP-3-O-(3-hydroxymyristoyl)glucosamine N-acyltransferase [Xanthocytophaga flavus]